MASKSSSTPSIQSTITGSKRKSNDIGWEYAICPDPSNLDKIKCTLCGKTFSGGVNRMKQHIAHQVGNVAPCPKSTKDDQLRCRNAINEAKLKKKDKQAYDEALRAGVRFDSKESTVDDIAGSLGSAKEPNVMGPMDNFANKINPEEALNLGKGKNVDVNNAIRKERAAIVKSFIGRWAFECAIPFHAFEKDSFKMMVEAIGQFGTGLPNLTRYELSNTILKSEVERTKNMVKRNEDEWKQDGCSVMTDAWSDRKRRSIMNLCVNSKMGTVFLSSKECFGEAHTSQHIYEYVEACIQDVGPENVVQVVTDNATNNMGAAKLLKQKRPKIFWTSCATHTINLMLEGIGGLPRFKKVLDQAKKLTIFIYGHHKTLAMMRKYTDDREIIRPGVTRFASSYLTLQSLSDKKEQLKHMFTSNEWEECKFSSTVKGRFARNLVTSSAFWGGVKNCLLVFTPLVKVLRMVDADWKPSMGFVYGEIQIAKKKIIDDLGGNKKAYESIINIISKKMKGRLDTNLHLTSYLLNPYYHYKDPEIQHDPDVMDAILEFFDTLLAGDLDMQRQVITVELPKYKKKVDRFGQELAIKSCEVNNADFDPTTWWGTFGCSTPHLKKIAMRILSLTSSSSGCERNWSTIEGIHTKKRNRLDTKKLNNLVYVQFNANLMEKNKRRKDRNMEVLLASESDEAQEWIGNCGRNEVDPGSNGEAVGDALGTDEPRQSSRIRELLDDDFDSESEEEVYEEVESESDEVEIM